MIPRPFFFEYLLTEASGPVSLFGIMGNLHMRAGKRQPMSSPSISNHSAPSSSQSVDLPGLPSLGERSGSFNELLTNNGMESFDGAASSQYHAADLFQKRAAQFATNTPPSNENQQVPVAQSTASQHQTTNLPRGPASQSAADISLSNGNQQAPAAQAVFSQSDAANPQGPVAQADANLSISDTNQRAPAAQGNPVQFNVNSSASPFSQGKFHSAQYGEPQFIRTTKGYYFALDGNLSPSPGPYVPALCGMALDTTNARNRTGGWFVPDDPVRGSSMDPGSQFSSHSIQDGESAYDSSRDPSPVDLHNYQQRAMRRANWGYRTPPNAGSHVGVPTSGGSFTLGAPSYGHSSPVKPPTRLSFPEPNVPDFVPKMSRLLNADSDDEVDTNTIFATANEANYFQQEDIPDDDTLPESHQQQRAVVKALFDAIKSTEHAQDNPGMIKPFLEGKYSDCRIERLCWTIMHTCSIRHISGSLLAPYEMKRRQTMEMPSYAERMAKIIECLTVSQSHSSVIHLSVFNKTD